VPRLARIIAPHHVPVLLHEQDVRPRRVQDWQFETRQAVALDRRPDGRYALAFGPTTLLLRPDGTGDFLGFPFDE